MYISGVIDQLRGEQKDNSVSAKATFTAVCSGYHCFWLSIRGGYFCQSICQTFRPLSLRRPSAEVFGIERCDREQLGTIILLVFFCVIPVVSR